MGFLLFIIFALMLRAVIAKRSHGVLLWMCVILTFVAAVVAVSQLQVMVPESWSFGLWIIGVTSLMLLVIPLPIFGKFRTVTKIVIALVVLAYPAWLSMQMAMVYVAIQSEDRQTVNQRVDFDAMRDSVERQLSAHFDTIDASRAMRESDESGVFAGVKSKFLSGARMSRRWLVRKLARNILTPEGLKKVIDQQPGEARAAGPPWNERLRIENVYRWKLWTNAGWVGFEPSGESQRIQLRSIEFFPKVLAQIEEQ